MTTDIHTSNGLFVNNGRILLLLRDNNKSIPEPNKWSLIGGEIDAGEDHKSALLRESQEEIGIKPKNYSYLGVVQTQDKKLHALYFIQLDDKEANSVKLGNEGQKIQFFNPEELDQIELTRNLEHYFNEHKDYLTIVIKENIQPDPGKLGLRI